MSRDFLFNVVDYANFRAINTADFGTIGGLAQKLSVAQNGFVLGVDVNHQIAIIDNVPGNFTINPVGSNINTVLLNVVVTVNIDNNILLAGTSTSNAVIKQNLRMNDVNCIPLLIMPLNPPALNNVLSFAGGIGNTLIWSTVGGIDAPAGASNQINVVQNVQPPQAFLGVVPTNTYTISMAQDIILNEDINANIPSIQVNDNSGD